MKKGGSAKGKRGKKGGRERKRDERTLAYRTFGSRDGFGGVEDGDVVEELLVESFVGVLEEEIERVISSGSPLRRRKRRRD